MLELLESTKAVKLMNFTFLLINHFLQILGLIKSSCSQSGDLSNLIRSFDSISGGFLSNYFNAC